MEVLFLKKIARLIAVTSLILLVIWFIAAPIVREKDTFLAATIDKQNRLKNLPSPRLVFVGGSNLAFGIDSKRIEDSLKITVVNMGLHAGLGLGYMLKETQDNLKPGDIVVLSPEYHLTKKGNTKLKTQLIDINPNALSYACDGINDYIAIFFTNIQRCSSGLFYKIVEASFATTNTDNIYNRSSFSIQGDIIVHLNEPSRYVFKPDPSIKYNHTEEVAALSEFIDLAKAKKCCVYFLYPNIAQSAYRQQLKSINNYKDLVSQKLSCTILNDGETIALPDSLFFDSKYHLIRTGRTQKTDFLIKSLRKATVDMNCN